MRLTADATWQRIADCDGRTADGGKTNAFGGCDWIRMCSQHTDLYNDWILPRRCIVRGCAEHCSFDVDADKLSRVCAKHQQTERKQSDVEGDDADEIYEQADATDNKDGSEGRLGVSALGRVMRLQKRAARSDPNIHERGMRGKEEPETRANSRESRCIRGSSRGQNSDHGARLSPGLEERRSADHGTAPITGRRKSAGGPTGFLVAGALPFELVRRPIRPIAAPLASRKLELPAVASPENELIVNKLEAIEEREKRSRSNMGENGEIYIV